MKIPFKNIITALLILTYSLCHSQKKDNIKFDSLKKYSYFIGMEKIEPLSEGLVTIHIGNGTAFFIRQNAKLYLITARHNLVDCRNGNKLFLKKLFFWLQDEKGFPTKKIFIEPTQFVDLKCRDQISDTDAIAIKVDIDLDVFSIESFIKDIPNEYDEISIYGYPENRKDTSKKTDYQLVSNTIIPKDSFSHNTIQDPKTKITDLVNSYLLSRTSINNNGRSGYSGSPTFMKDKRTGVWVFIGLNWGHGEFNKGEKYLALVRPDIVLKQIQSLADKFIIR